MSTLLKPRRQAPEAGKLEHHDLNYMPSGLEGKAHGIPAMITLNRLNPCSNC